MVSLSIYEEHNMSNARSGYSVTLEQWINNPGIREGILAVYANRPFDYEDNRASYEIGRQIALLGREAGLSTRGAILRKKPNSEQLAAALKGSEWDSPAGKIIRAEVPLSEMFGYATDLRSMSQGRAVYSMEFLKYNEVPNNVADSVIKKAS